jgi:phenylacetate-CoA ligase
VQTALDLVELRYVMERPLSAAEEERLTRMLQSRLGYPFRIGFNRVERLARQPGGKFEDFISEIG